MIGVIGLQLSNGSSVVVSKLLPFYGPRRLIEAGLAHEGALLVPLLQTVAYGFALLVVARIVISRRVFVRKHPPASS